MAPSALRTESPKRRGRAPGKALDAPRTGRQRHDGECAAADATEQIDSARGGAAKARAAAEGALTRSVGTVVSIVRSAANALHQDVKAFVASVDQLASAHSLGEAFKIRSDLIFAHAEAAAARAKSEADVLVRPYLAGANSVQESFAKAPDAIGNGKAGRSGWAGLPSRRAGTSFGLARLRIGVAGSPTPSRLRLLGR